MSGSGSRIEDNNGNTRRSTLKMTKGNSFSKKFFDQSNLYESVVRDEEDKI